MGYQSCIDWCHNHPALLTFLIILSILFPFFLYATTRNTTNLSTDQSSTNPQNTIPDLEKQQPQHGTYQPCERQPAWSRLLAILRPSSCNNDHHCDLDPDDHIEPQEKTPLIGSMPGEQAWRTGGQLANNWHGTNQLNTSWSYMA